MKNLIIRYARNQDADKISQFRINQYKTAKEFEIVNIEALTKQRGQVYIVEVDNILVSTMQMEIFYNREEFERVETSSIPFDFNLFPNINLSKAASSKEYRNLGLNSILRLIILELAIKNNAIKSITGCGYENAPRFNLLQKIGYEFTEVIPNQSYFKPLEKELFFCLPREKFDSAMEILKNEIKELQSNFKFEFQIDDNLINLNVE